MKTIHFPPTESELDARDILKTVLSRFAPEQGGIDLMQMRLHLRMLDKLEQANGALVLDDSEYQTLQQHYRKARFLMVHPFFVALADAIDQAQESSA